MNADYVWSESADDGHVLTADGSGGADWEAPSGGGGGPEFARVTLSASVSLTANTFNTISWGTEVFDDNDFFSSTNPTRLTVPSGCTRATLTGGGTYGTGANGADMGIRFRKNGTDVVGQESHDDLYMGNHTGYQAAMTAESGPLSVAENDYFEMQISRDNAAGATLADSDLSFFAIQCH